LPTNGILANALRTTPIAPAIILIIATPKPTNRLITPFTMPATPAIKNLNASPQFPLNI